MKTKLRSLGFIAVIAINLNAVFVAQADSQESEFFWERHAEGIGLAMSFKDLKDATPEKGFFNLRIKNTSDSPKEIFDQGRSPVFQLFYINERDEKIKFSDHKFNSFSSMVLLDKGSLLISPGEEMSFGAYINAEEIVFVKTRPVMCRIVVLDPASQKKYVIESKPRILPGAL